MFTKIDLCSMALVKLGEKPIQSLLEDSAAANLSRTLFDSITDTLLASFPWRFATQNIILTRNTDEDFVIPANVLRVLKCNEQIIGNKINAAADTIEITAIVKTEPEAFPGFFASLLATKLATEFCIPLLGDANVFKMMMALYESEYQTAKFIDSTTSTSKSSVNNFSLINSRF